MRRSTIAAFALLLTPALASAAAPRTFLDLANVVVSLLDSGIGVLLAAGLVIYFWGISTNILKIGEGEKEKMRDYFYWGILILFVMVSIWGIVRLLQSTLFGDAQTSPATGAQAAQQSQFQAPQYAE